MTSTPPFVSPTLPNCVLTAYTRTNQVPCRLEWNVKPLLNASTLSVTILPSIGKLASRDASTTYAPAPLAALQSNEMCSNGWNNVVPPLAGRSTGEPGAVALWPVTLKLRTDDQSPCALLPLTAWTRQK